jgi:ABC-type transport system involved in multi-copper enzyme maturation permease subunit
MGASFRAELLKLRKRPAIWILIVVFLLLSQVFGYLIPYVSYRSGGGGPGFVGAAPSNQILADILPAGLVANAIEGFPLFGGAIALIIGALASGSEYGWGTLTTTLTQRPPRRSVYAGKLAAVAVLVLALVVAGFALSSLSSAVIASVESKALDWPSPADLSRGIGSGWLILGVWSLVGMTLGIVLRGTSLAVGLGLVWALVIENLVRGVAPLLGLFDALQTGLPGVNAGSLVSALGGTSAGQPGGTPGVTSAVSGPQATVVLLAYAVGLALLAGFTLRRQDVT